MLELESVAYRYAGAASRALEGISLELRGGEIVGVVGASESGKSTLCLVSAGLAPRTIGGTLEGRLILDGVDTTEMPAYEFAQRCGIVFQDPAHQLSRTAPTVWEEVAFGPRNLALPLGDVIERTDAAIRSMAIEALADRDPARLSGGQGQLVAIAGILAMRPTHLILDEPTAQLDPQGTELVAEAIAALAAAGSSILIAEQKTDVLERVAGRIVVLADGRVMMDGPTAEVLADRRLADLGIAPPAGVRLRQAIAGAGLDPRVLESAA